MPTSRRGSKFSPSVSGRRTPIPNRYSSYSNLERLARGSRQRGPAIGKAIEAVRRERGWSQSELARRSGLTPPTVSRIEAGSRKGDVDTLAQLASGLGLPLSVLFGRAERLTKGSA